MADILLGTANAEGFGPTGQRFYDALGRISAEGQAPTVTVERIYVGDVGEAQALGFAPTVDIVLPVAEETQDYGAGSGGFRDQIIEEDRIVLAIIREFLKAA